MFFIYDNKRNSRNTLFDMNDDDEYIAFLEDLINRTKSTEIKTGRIIIC